MKSEALCRHLVGKPCLWIWSHRTRLQVHGLILHHSWGCASLGITYLVSYSYRTVRRNYAPMQGSHKWMHLSCMFELFCSACLLARRQRQTDSFVPTVAESIAFNFFSRGASTEYSIIETADFLARSGPPLPFFAERREGFVFPSMSPYLLHFRDGSSHYRGFANEVVRTTLEGVA
jgi:hypothetical protein